MNYGTDTEGLYEYFKINKLLRIHPFYCGSLSDYGEEDGKEPPLPPEPTYAIPGTKAKIEVMRKRAAMGFAIFHPDDATIEHIKEI